MWGFLIKPTRMTVGEFLEQWLKDYVTTNTAPRTGERYDQIVHLHLIPNLGSINLTDLRPDHVQDYYAKALEKGRWDGKGGLSAQTVKHHHRVLSEALNYAVKWGLVARNIAQAVDPPRPRKQEMNTLNPEDIPLLFDEARKMENSSGLPYYVLFLAALHTGMRRGELLGLRWRDIDLDRAIISVNRSLQGLRNGNIIFMEPKTHKARRLITMTPTLASEMCQYMLEQESLKSSIGVELTENDLVFSNPDGKPINPNSVSPAFSKIAKRAGLKLRLHDLRHSHATLMLRAGIHPKIVSERLDHATISTTLDLYSHVSPSLQQEAAESFDRVVNSRREKSVIEDHY